ncbi:MAG: Stp1/IreP family PP2C-type Ser/Thr phosphatase [Rhodoferax sp.]|nr:Stp1/IreP family PP2C-type Ser/Thr phosphatase [Rhodoferax sp.]
MKCHIVALSDRGLCRDNNEDAVWFDDTLALAVLADGMGGHQSGEVASRMAVGVIRAELPSSLPQAGDPEALASACRSVESSVALANRRLHQAGQSHPALSGMGTTLVLGLFRDEGLVLGHIGDSRCYRWRAGELLQLTRDHSVLQQEIDKGAITPEQAWWSPHRNLVTRALGVEPVARMEIQQLDLRARDLYLFCSDGLTDMVRDTTIAGVLRQDLGLTQQAQVLIELANAGGGRDNISVVLVRLEALEGGARQPTRQALQSSS